VKISYKQILDNSTAGFYTKTGQSNLDATDYPSKVRELNAPFIVVDKIEEFNGNTDATKQYNAISYTYKGFKTTTNAGLLGFEEMTSATKAYNEDGTMATLKTVNTYDHKIFYANAVTYYNPELKSSITYLDDKKVVEIIRSNEVQIFSTPNTSVTKWRYAVYAPTVTTIQYDPLSATNAPLTKTIKTTAYPSGYWWYYANPNTTSTVVQQYNGTVWAEIQKQTTEYSYNTGSAPPLKALPAFIVINAKRGTKPTEYRRAEFEYNAKGSITKNTIIYPNTTTATPNYLTGKKLETTYTYDMTNGNVISQSVKDPSYNNGETRTMAFEYYNDIPNIVPPNVITKVTLNPTGANLVTYQAGGFDNRNGQVGYITDIDGNTTSMVYDTWGALKEVYLPTSRIMKVVTERVLAINTQAPTGAVVQTTLYNNIIATGTAPYTITTPARTTYYDKLGRTMRIVTPFDDSSLPVVTNGDDPQPPTLPKYRYQDMTYNLRGQTATVSEPYESTTTPTYFTTYTYYKDGNLKQVTQPTGTYTLYEYNGFVIKKTEGNISGGMTARVSTYTMDATNALKSATDPGGTITYDYNSIGAISTLTQNASGVISYKYDFLGKVKEVNDPNKGISTATYNAFGEMLQSVSPAPSGFASATVTHTNTYDALGRVTKIAAPEGNFIYNYTTTGKLNYRQSPNGWKESFVYNAPLSYLSEHRFENVTNAAEPVLSTKYTYDALNRISEVEYPDGTKSLNAYNYYEHLTQVSVKESGMATYKPIWRPTATNIYGQTTKAQNFTYSNFATAPYSGINYLETTKGFTPLGFPTLTKMVRTTNGVVGNTLHHWEYLFNEKTGNLTNRTDKLAAGGAGKTEQFTYDALMDRLTNIQIVGGTAASITYGTNGNIVAKSDAGTYRYGAALGVLANKPHAVNQIYPYVADNIPTSLQNITYTSFSKTATITDDATIENNAHSFKRATFDYAPDGQRIKMTYQTQTAPLTPSPTAWETQYTRYYADNFEREISSNGTVTNRCYIYGTDQIIALHQKTTVAASTTQKMFYVGTDYLGSLLTFVDANGTVAEKHGYDAWGRLRNPDTWVAFSNTNIAPTYQFSRGYTGHEHLQEFGLINMNARMYDPLLGRMLAPDNNIGSGTSTQALNRYSYVGNNPLKYTDPTGWFSVGIGHSITQSMASSGIIGPGVIDGGGATASSVGRIMSASTTTALAAASFYLGIAYFAVAITNTIADGLQFSVQSPKCNPVSAPNYAALNTNAAATARNGIGTKPHVSDMGGGDSVGEDWGDLFEPPGGYPGRGVKAPIKEDQDKILDLIHQRAQGQFRFDDNGNLQPVSDRRTGDDNLSSHYRDRLKEQIASDKTEVLIMLGEEVANRYIVNSDGSVSQNPDADCVNITNEFGGGVTLGSDRSIQQLVYISGKEGGGGFVIGATTGMAIYYGPADILLHELIGHAIPHNLGGGTGNAIDNENVARKQMGNKGLQPRKQDTGLQPHNE
jgi:RHS repeat-associated protein